MQRRNGVLEPLAANLRPRCLDAARQPFLEPGLKRRDVNVVVICNVDPVDAIAPAKELLCRRDVHYDDIAVVDLADSGFAKNAANRQVEFPRLRVDGEFAPIDQAKSLSKTA